MMIDLYPWTKNLNISDEQIANWQSMVSANTNFTFWCLNQKLIDETKYLNWAQEYYQLCKLDDKFLQSEENLIFAHNFLDSSNTYNEWNIPIAKWESHLYIACVEPPNDFHTQNNFIYVLTSSESLKAIWNHLNAKSETNVRLSENDKSRDILIHQQNDLSQKIELNFDQPPINFEKFELSTEEENDNNHEHSIQETENHSTEEVEENHLDGINYDLLNLSSSSTKETGLNFDLLNIDQNNSSEKITQSPEEPLVSHTPESQLKVDTLSFNTSLNNYIDDNEVSENKPEEYDNPPIPKNEFKPNFELYDSQKTDIPNQVTNSSSISSELKTKTLPPPPNSIDDATTNSEAVSWAFNHLKKHYLKSIAFIFENGNLKPWLWDKDWSPLNDSKLMPFAIESPSFFRVVHRTNLPYHGYVVPNTFNETFFKDWGLEKIPEHITVHPFKLNPITNGMLLSIGSIECFNDQTLLEHEKTTFRMADSFNKILKKSA